jgi:hypothetical protein
MHDIIDARILLGRWDILILLQQLVTKRLIKYIYNLVEIHCNIQLIEFAALIFDSINTTADQIIFKCLSTIISNT